MKQFNDFIRMDGVRLNCSNPTCLSSNLAIHDSHRKVAGGFKVQYQCLECHRFTTDNKVYK